MTVDSRPVVLVVASWYPSVDLPIAGRFVADQVAAVNAGGVLAPVVASFDPLPLWGSANLRRRQAAAVREVAATGLAGAGGGPFVLVPDAFGRRVPVAWLPVPGNARGVGRADGSADDRAAVLQLGAAAIDAVGGPPALIHAHTGFPDGAAAAVEAARRGIPLVITEHLSTLGAIARDPVRRARYTAAVMAASRIVTVSERLAAEVLDLVPDAGGRLVVIPNMVDADAFAAGRRTDAVADELLFVGNRKHSKGIGELLEAFALARAQRRSLRLRLIGAAPATLDEAWRQKAARLGVADAVEFGPEMDRPGVAAAMARATLFVHPSPRETFGVVAAEALAAGLPVVAVDSGGVTEVLGPDVAANGAIVPAGDPGTLAAAILDVLARRDDFPAEELRSRAVARFGPGSIARRLTEVYEAALGCPVTPRTGSSPEVATRPASMSASGEAQRSRSPDAVAPPPRRTVVAFDVPRAARVLGALSADERSRTSLVTARAEADALPAVADTTIVARLAERHASLRAVAGASEAARPSRRTLALLAHPVVLLREARQRSPRMEGTLVDEAATAVRRAAPSGSVLTALDGFDALVSLGIVRDGSVAASPGAGRWLAAAGNELAVAVRAREVVPPDGPPAGVHERRDTDGPPMADRDMPR